MKRRYVLVLMFAGEPRDTLGAFYSPERAQAVGERLWRLCPELPARGFKFAVSELLRPRDVVQGT